jgi:hypothetical protein
MVTRRQSKDRKGQGQNMSFKDMSPMTYFLQQNHLPIVYSNLIFINKSSHLLGQSPHDLIFPGNSLKITRGVLTNLLIISQSNKADNKD